MATASTKKAPRISPVLKGVTRGEPLTHWQYAMAGDSIFTLAARATGKEYTYRVRHWVSDRNGRDHFYASLLRGPDNTGDYTDMGEIFQGGRLHETWKMRERGQTVNHNAPSTAALEWFLKLAKRGKDGAIDAACELVPSTHCIMCGRLLTKRSSVYEQIGPVCAGRL